MADPIIFAFVNGGIPGLLHVIALSEDGVCLAGHGSSDVAWARHDIGVSSDWHHEAYRAHYPDGYEVRWVDNVPADPACLAAIAKANARGAAVPAGDTDGDEGRGPGGAKP